MPRPTPKNPGTPLKPAFRLWMEDGKNEVMFDQTDAFLLRRVDETHSLTRRRRRSGSPTGTRGTA